jgi:DNA-binding CsgD family transcriptional regulator
MECSHNFGGMIEAQLRLVDLLEVSVSKFAEGGMDCKRIEPALDAIAHAHKSQELLKVMNELREIYGLSHVAYAGLRMPDLADTDHYFILTYPDEWMERYWREEFFRIDPVYAASRTGFLPIDWRTLDLQSPDAHYFFSEAARYGIGALGMSFPMRGPDGDAGALSFTANVKPEEWDAFKNRNQSEIAFVGLYFHERVIRIWSDEHGLKVRPSLTARERECLQRLAEGDPPKKIATALKLSEAAVRLYLKRARARLGAVNLMQAVIIALRANLITVP